MECFHGTDEVMFHGMFSQNPRGKVSWNVSRFCRVGRMLWNVFTAPKSVEICY
jgi:hypothetical protein